MFVFPLLMLVMLVGIVLFLVRPMRRRSVQPLRSGQEARYFALCYPDGKPRQFLTPFDDAVTGVLVLTSDHLAWHPDTGAEGAWQEPLSAVHVVERPPPATRRLVLSASGRTMSFVVDASKRVHRYAHTSMSDRRQLRSGRRLADLIDADHRSAPLATPMR